MRRRNLAPLPPNTGHCRLNEPRVSVNGVTMGAMKWTPVQSACNGLSALPQNEPRESSLLVARGNHYAKCLEVANPWLPRARKASPKRQGTHQKLKQKPKRCHQTGRMRLFQGAPRTQTPTRPPTHAAPKECDQNSRRLMQRR